MTFKCINMIKPDEDLGKIVGHEVEPYTVKLKKLWVYMRANSLVVKVPNPKYKAKA